MAWVPTMGPSTQAALSPASLSQHHANAPRTPAEPSVSKTCTHHPRRACESELRLNQKTTKDARDNGNEDMSTSRLPVGCFPAPRNPVLKVQPFLQQGDPGETC